MIPHSLEIQPAAYKYIYKYIQVYTRMTKRARYNIEKVESMLKKLKGDMCMYYLLSF